MTEQVDQSRMRRLFAAISSSTVVIALLLSSSRLVGPAAAFPVVIASMALMIICVGVWLLRLWRVGRIDLRDKSLVLPRYKPMLRTIGILRVSFAAAGLLLLIVGLVALVIGAGAAVVFNAFLIVSATMYLNLSVGGTLGNIAIMRSARRGPHVPH